MLVVDASVILEVLLCTAVGVRAAERLLKTDESLHAPHLLDVEVTQVLRRLALAGELTDARGRQAIGDLADTAVVRHEHTVLLPRVWELRTSVSAYDAVYLALAEALAAPLLTCDGRLSRAHGHHARVELLD